MKNIFPLLVVLFFLTGCERNEPGPDPHADWKVVDIPTDIHLNKVFFVNEKTGFVAGTFKFQKLKVVISQLQMRVIAGILKMICTRGIFILNRGNTKKQ